MSPKYILNGREPVIEPNLLKYLLWFATTDRTVRKNKIIPMLRGAPIDYPEINVSTVFIGNNGIMFQTMIFGGPLDDTWSQCATWEEAEPMHARMCERVNQALRAEATEQIKRQTCTKTNPMPADAKGFWQHPDALYLLDRDTRDGSYEWYVCPHCGLKFSVTVPD